MLARHHDGAPDRSVPSTALRIHPRRERNFIKQEGTVATCAEHPERSLP